MRLRTGTIYSEITNSGMHLIGDNRPIYKNRYVGELTVNGKRYRFRSTNRTNVEHWISDMVRKYPEYSTRTSHGVGVGIGNEPALRIKR